MKYEPAVRTATGPQPGAVALRDYARSHNFGDAGIFNPRPIRGGTTLSLHAEGRAVDLTRGSRTDVDLDLLVNLLVWFHKELGVQQVIWQRTVWTVNKTWRRYTGTDPHTSHAHVELTRAAAAGLTVDVLRRVLDPVPAPSAAPGRLLPGESLAPGESLFSPSGNFRLVYQGDGNLVLYRADGKALWASNTYGTEPGTAVLQGDGNLVAYSPGMKAQWASGTQTPNSRLDVQDDGNLVIYAGSRALWSTGTWGGVQAETRPTRMTLRNPMSRGAADIFVFQRAMNALSGAGLRVDGVYGTASERACRNWQGFFGLQVDGVCGPATWDLIYYVAGLRGVTVA